MTQKRKNAMLILMLCSILAVAFVSLASAESTTATMTATATSTSGVIYVSGSGFNVSETVYLALLNETDSSVVYNFTETPTTNSLGNFTANLILPTDVYGTFNLTAHTSTVTTYTEYTIAKAASPSITITPDNSNIIAVAGSGFNTSETVTLELLDSAETTVYTFPENATTDTQGNFTATIIIPTSLSGNYTLTALTTSGATANATVTVPDFTGPTGATGAAGVAGEAGATGTNGEAADTTVAYAAIALSIAAIAIAAALAILLKH